MNKKNLTQCVNNNTNVKRNKYIQRQKGMKAKCNKGIKEVEYDDKTITKYF